MTMYMVVRVIFAGVIGGSIGMVMAYYVGYPFTAWQVWHDWPYESPFWAHRTLKQWYRAHWRGLPFGLRGSDPKAQLPEEA